LSEPGILGTPNPAVTSELVASVFPPGVAAAELREPVSGAHLFPAESAAVARAAPKRLAEFTAGRLCARRALTQLGIIHFPLCVNENRTPRWPEGVVGSITHTAGFCGAVAAQRVKFEALGLDAEHTSAATSDLWPQLLTAAERDRLARLTPESRTLVASTIFSAKEAFYKAQFTITRGWLDFDDVEIDLSPAATAYGTFTIRILRNAPPELSQRAAGCYRILDDVVLTGVAFAA
jgi:4'-phosphopantetheinyl transferase EntD